MGIKLAEVRRVLAADTYLKDAAPEMKEEERSIVALRLEYFDRVGVRLHYMARDIEKHGGDSPELKVFCKVACDILGFASLTRPFHRRPIEERETVTWAIDTMYTLYRAADKLLRGDVEGAKLLVNRVTKQGKPKGWGSVFSSRFDKQLNALLGLGA